MITSYYSSLPYFIKLSFRYHSYKCTLLKIFAVMKNLCFIKLYNFYLSVLLLIYQE